MALGPSTALCNHYFHRAPKLFPPPEEALTHEAVRATPHSPSFPVPGNYQSTLSLWIWRGRIFTGEFLSASNLLAHAPNYSLEMELDESEFDLFILCPVSLFLSLGFPIYETKYLPHRTVLNIKREKPHKAVSTELPHREYLMNSSCNICCSMKMSTWKISNKHVNSISASYMKIFLQMKFSRKSEERLILHINGWSMFLASHWL